MDRTMQCYNLLFRKDRITIQEKERNEAKMKDLEVENKKQAEDRRKHTLKVKHKLQFASQYLSDFSDRCTKSVL